MRLSVKVWQISQEALLDELAVIEGVKDSTRFILLTSFSHLVVVTGHPGEQMLLTFIDTC